MNIYRCSFCDRRNEGGTYLLAGPKHVYICDGCIIKCNELIAMYEAKGTDVRRVQGKSNAEVD